MFSITFFMLRLLLYRGVKVLQGMLRAGLGVEYFSRNENDAFYEVVQAGVDH